MKEADRQQTLSDLKWELHGIDNATMIAEMEQKAKEKIAKGLHKTRGKKKRKKKNG